MRRTSPLLLAVAAVLGAGSGFLVDQALTAAGRPSFTPATMLPILLVLLGVILILLALPIRRAIRSRGVPAEAVQGAPPQPVNPFRALRVAILAKASSIVGAVVGGVGVGLLAFLLSRPVPPPLGSTGAVVATVVAAAILVAAALVAENMCIIRKDDDDEPPAPELGTGHTHDW